MEVGAKNSSKALPYDSKVEYLESSGTQYIDPDSIWSHRDQFELEFDLVKFRRFDTVFGVYMNDGSLDTLTLRMNNIGTNGFGDLAANVVMPVPVVENYNYRLRLNNADADSRAIVNDTDEYTWRRKDTQHRILEFSLHFNVFGLNYYYAFPTMAQVVNYMPFIRLHSFKQLDERGAAIRDLIPVRVGDDGFLYDKVTKRLFGNKGTGKFILGPDVR